MTIINPRLTQKLTFSNQPKSPANKSSNTKINVKPTVVVSSLAIKNQPKKNENNNSDLTELDAVKALLSMKSRASSMPPSGTDENKNEQIKQGRRKQVFKPPMKKPHINPKLLEKCSNALYFNDNEEDDEEIEEDFEDEDEFNFSQEEDEKLEKPKSNKKLQIKFPSFTPKKSSVNEHIVTMSDDESDSYEENKLEIDESFSDQKEKTEEKTDETIIKNEEEMITEESNESNLEPGEVRRTNDKKEKSDQSNLLLALSRAATLVEDIKKTGESEESSPSKAKKAKLSIESSPARSTRSSSNTATKIESRTVTRSTTSKRKVTK